MPTPNNTSKNPDAVLPKLAAILAALIIVVFTLQSYHPILRSEAAGPIGDITKMVQEAGSIEQAETKLELFCKDTRSTPKTYGSLTWTCTAATWKDLGITDIYVTIADASGNENGTATIGIDRGTLQTRFVSYQAPER